MKLTITHNGFHGYTSSTLVLNGKPGEQIQLSSSQVRKLKRAACGMSDCKCGESLLDACYVPEPWKDSPAVFIDIPESGNEIKIKGNYPQR